MRLYLNKICKGIMTASCEKQMFNCIDCVVYFKSQKYIFLKTVLAVHTISF